MAEEAINMSEFYNKQINEHGYWWSGDYPTWDDAEKECTGYSDDLFITEKLLS